MIGVKHVLRSKTVWGVILFVICTVRDWFGVAPPTDIQIAAWLDFIEQLGQVVGVLLALLGRLVADARLTLSTPPPPPPPPEAPPPPTRRTTMRTEAQRTNRHIVPDLVIALMLAAMVAAASGCGAVRAIVAPPAEMTATNRWLTVRDTVTDLQDSAVRLHEAKAIDTETFLQAHSVLKAARDALAAAQAFLPDGGAEFDRIIKLTESRLDKLEQEELSDGDEPDGGGDS